MNSKFVLPLGMLVLFLISGYFIGCERENTVATKTGKHLAELDGIVSTINADRSPSSWVKIQQGMVKVIPAKEGRLIITCDIPNEPTIITYRLQSGTNYSSHSYDLGNSEILFLENELLINSIDQGKVFKVYLADIKDSYLEAIPADLEFIGFGLGSQLQSRGLNPRVGPECRCEPTTVNDSDCESGGHGSSSCSVTIASGSCSTTCSAGYFACCDHEGGSY